MKVYDCFMFFDEEMLLDLRLNIMDKYVDKFVITEAIYTHSGTPKKLMYIHSIDKKGNKWGEGAKLQSTKLEEMPKYIVENVGKYRPWLDT